MNFDSLDHTVSPDIFTSSEDYDKRFSGDVGAYFLDVQWKAVKECLSKLVDSNLTISVLEVGGGHLQITENLLDLGYKVTVHGSSDEALNKLRSSNLAGRVDALAMPLSELKNHNAQYDLVIALRLVPHVLDEESLLFELSRLSKVGIIFDFASTKGLNALSKIAFKFKKKIEKNTRPYFNHSPAKIKALMATLGYRESSFKGQFVAPMGIHRALKNVSVSRLIEGMLSPFRNLWGNPIIGCGKK
jgi:2-polyprenyl-3-methyl-5-hydroxy-6-metoxy-1,4-benzoquinol methylase